MNRKALIITNPGAVGSEHYCEGVNKDKINYQQFLKSPIGGFWQLSEIAVLERPSASDLQRQLLTLRTADYGLFIFAGHGHFSTTKDTTIISLNDKDEWDGVALANGLAKATVVLDCCRKRELVTEAKATMFSNARLNSILNPADCRLYYDKKIEECAPGLVVCYGCAVGETAGDDSQQGGVYSYRVLKGVENWQTGANVDTSKNYRVQSIVRAHEDAAILVRAKTRDRQNPQITKPRSEPYFPFAVIA